MLEEALALHAQGRLAEAEQAYRAILAREPDNAEVGHQLGLLALDAGLPQHAAPIFEQACRLAPQNATFHANRGLSYLHLQRTDEALAALDRAIALNPYLHQAHVNRGSVLMQAQRPQEALDSFSRAAELHESAAIHNFRALMLDELGRYDEALESFGKALALDPDNAMAQSNYGHALTRHFRYLEALPHFEKAVALAPQDPGMHYNVADPLKALGRLEEALAAYDRALALDPEMAIAHINRGLVLGHMGRYADALAAFDRAVALEPEAIAAHIGRNVVLASSGRVDEALAINRDLARNPAFRPEADFQSAMFLLDRGDWEDGWKFYEARWSLRRNGERPAFPQPLWLGGEDLAGKTLFVHGEQGLGDEIMFARYLPLARRKGAHVVFAPRGRLTRLFSGQGLADAVLAPRAVPASFDYHIPAASLPLAFGTRPATIPAHIPYLQAEPSLVEAWRARIGAEGFKIGVCWAGSNDPLQGLDRAFPLRLLQPLAALPGVRLISLQKMVALDELDTLPDGMTVETLGEDFDAGPDAFVDTAAVMASLDLVISCDTSIAHLAGALGRPTWTAVKRNAEWRWRLDDAAMPWYPTMTLYRQPQAGDWQSVFAAMRDALAARLEKA